MKKGQSCQKETPCADVLITDLKMPGMNGIELLQQQSNEGCPLDTKNKAIITAALDKESDGAIKKAQVCIYREAL